MALGESLKKQEKVVPKVHLTVLPLDLRMMGERKRSTMRHLFTWRIFTGHLPYVRPFAWRWKYGNPNRAVVLGASSNPRER